MTGRVGEAAWGRVAVSVVLGMVVLLSDAKARE
jgi:hypothetical protein